MADEPQYAIAVNRQIAPSDGLFSFSDPLALSPSFEFEFRYEGRPVLTFHADRMEISGSDGLDALTEMMRKANEYDRLAAAARALVLATTPFMSALELGHNGPDGERLHQELREAVGVSYDEWRDSDER